MTIARHHAIIAAEKLLNSLGLGRRFDDDKILWCAHIGSFLLQGAKLVIFLILM